MINGSKYIINVKIARGDRIPLNTLADRKTMKMKLKKKASGEFLINLMVFCRHLILTLPQMTFFLGHSITLTSSVSDENELHNVPAAIISSLKAIMFVCLSVHNEVHICSNAVMGISSQVSNNHNPNNKTTKTVVGLRL